MVWWLFLDDERYPASKDITCHIARNVDDALWMVKTYGLPSSMSLDHDLGYGKQSGMDFIIQLCNMAIDDGLDLSKCVIQVHSMNPVGANNMKAYLASFLKEYNT